MQMKLELPPEQATEKKDKREGVLLWARTTGTCSTARACDCTKTYRTLQVGLYVV